MGRTKLSPGTWLAPFYGWTRGDYERALLVGPRPPAPSPPPAPPTPVAAFLAAVGDSAAWHERAACREHPAVDFFPKAEADAAAARAVCSRCPVVAECLAAAVDNNEAGIWGATSERERRAVR